MDVIDEADAMSFVGRDCFASEGQFFGPREADGFVEREYDLRDAEPDDVVLIEDTAEERSAG